MAKLRITYRFSHTTVVEIDSEDQVLTDFVRRVGEDPSDVQSIKYALLIASEPPYEQGTVVACGTEQIQVLDVQELADDEELNP